MIINAQMITLNHEILHSSIIRCKESFMIRLSIQGLSQSLCNQEILAKENLATFLVFVRRRGKSQKNVSISWLSSKCLFVHIHPISYLYISYFKHIYTGYKFNKDIVLQFGPVKIKVPNKLFTNKLIDKNIHIWRQ